MSLAHLTDFPDKLSPMLVKELRQGMRARSFTLLFLGFQGLLALILLTAGAAASSDEAGSFASGVIFTMFAGAALFIQPMRGVNALSSEISSNTIEMMVLTRLSAWRIVFGKWIAIVSQTALILVTIIPYLILRYFFGGMILAGEMVFLCLIFLTSMTLTAIMVGLSGNSTKLVRMLPVVGFVLMAGTVPDYLSHGGFKSLMNYCTLSDGESRMVIAAYVVFIIYIGWCALSHGTSVIAPAAENHSTLRRGIALGLVGITAVAGLHDGVNPQVLVLIFGIILVPAVVTALTEPSVLLPPICKPFLRRGLTGRMAGIILLPGWPAGVFFATLVLSISIAGIRIADGSNPHPDLLPETAIGALGCLGGILFAALLSAVFTKQESKRFTHFMVFLLVSILLAVIPMILTSINNHEKYLWFFIWNPPVSLFMAVSNGFVKSEVLAAVMIVDAIILLMLLVTAGSAFRGYRQIIEEAEAGLATPALPAP
ncbi:MAG: hypothetical protein V4819_16565 [Verrucomicrobiota bacterium]